MNSAMNKSFGRYGWIIALIIIVIVVVVIAFTQYGGSGVPAATTPPSASGASEQAGGLSLSPADVPDAAGTYVTHINESATRDGITATPVAIVEDSRCPVDVQCIQAGTVKVAVKFAYGVFSITRTLTLGQMISGDGFTGGLVAVSPDKHEGQDLAPGDYILTFTVAKQ